VLKPENYFDNAATTPVDPRVIREMLPYLETYWGNGNSLHAWGREAMAAVDLARERIANLVFADDPSQIFFTSGATESNNWIFNWAAHANRGNLPIGFSPFEHNAVLEPAKRIGAEVLLNRGYEIRQNKLHYFLVSVMIVNNEVGTDFEPEQLRDACDFLHSDYTQAVGKLPYHFEPVDFASFSAHKFYGPKGVGSLFARDPNILSPFVLGGEQEQGKRGGTLNVPGIVGMGAAAAIAQEEMADNLAKTEELRAIVLEAFRPCQDYQVNGGDNVSPYILSVSFKGLEGETLVIEMDQAGFAISSGAACSSRSTDPSHVLTALKMPKEWLRGTIRISFGRLNTKDSAAELGKSLRATVESLRNLRTI
jgi:cysteine desulfurase